MSGTCWEDLEVMPKNNVAALNPLPIRSLLLASLMLVLAALLVGCGDANGKGEDKDKKAEAPAVPVEVAEPKRADMAAVYTGTASLKADRMAIVVPKVSGEIRTILVDEGTEVREGQVLLRLDGDRMRLEAAQSEANLRKLERDYNRNIELQQKGLVSTLAFENLKYEMEAARAAHDLARLQLSYTEVRSPISGLVTRKFDMVKIGNTVTSAVSMTESTGALYWVEDMDSLVLTLSVPERELARLATGQPAQLAFDAVPGMLFEGKVVQISPFVMADTATFQVKIGVKDVSGRLRTGMFARVSIVYEKKDNALQIPRSALLESDGPPKVFVVRDGKAAEQEIAIGLTNGSVVEVTSGLADSDQVVVVGQAAVKPGAAVRVVNSPAQPAAKVAPAAAPAAG